MSGFLYFLPSESRATSRAELARAGLDYAFQAEPACREVRGGPGDLDGVILADPERWASADQVGFFAASQGWRKVPQSPAWVGRYLNQPPPGPQDLARGRDRFLSGHPIRLGDGREWTIPIVRGMSERDGAAFSFTALPRVVDWDPSGARIVGDVLPQYQALWEAAEKWLACKMAAKLDERTARLSVVLDENVALTALAANYAIGKAEAGILRLLNEQNELDVCDALIDWPSWRLWLKKKEASDIAPTASGPPDATAPTGPASPICTPSVSPGATANRSL